MLNLLLDVDSTPAFFGFMGCTCALGLASIGASYGTAKSGVGVASMGVLRPDMVTKGIIPVIMAGIIGIYGLIIAVIIASTVSSSSSYTSYKGYAHLGSGLSGGLACLSAGMCIGIVGDAGVRAAAQQPSLYNRVVLILIFAEALALYGLIVSLLLSFK